MNYIEMHGREVARQDFLRLRSQRRHWRDRRRSPPTAEDLVYRRYGVKREQMTMALHRQGLRSPYDYEYPRLKQMGKLARELHARYIVPLEAELAAFWEDDNASA